MQANRPRDTAPELAIRRACHSRGLRYRIHTRPVSSLRRQADMTFRKARVAVFIDGCYWHGCPIHFVEPKANASFWKDKIEKNRQRDAETNSELEKHGWIVLRFWEHEDPELCAGTIEQVVRQVTAVTKRCSDAAPDH